MVEQVTYNNVHTISMHHKQFGHKVTVLAFEWEGERYTTTAANSHPKEIIQIIRIHISMRFQYVK